MIHAQRQADVLIRGLAAIAMVASFQSFAAEPVAVSQQVEIGADPMYMAVYGREHQVASIRLRQPVVDSLAVDDDPGQDLALQWRPEAIVRGPVDSHR